MRNAASGTYVALTAMVMVCAAAQAVAQTAPAGIEGVWKMAAPAITLKPAAGTVPFTAEGRKAYEANKKLRRQRKFDEYDITLSRCSNPGVPRLALTPMRFKIRQRFGVMTFDYEWNHALRQIDVRGVATEPSLVPNMTGQAQGRWEGDTLVAVTSDVSDRTLIDDLIPHTDAMKVTERYRLVDANTLEDRITIEDPAYFSQPWEAVVTYQRQPDAIFPEDVCLDRVDAKQPAFPKQ